MRNIKILLWLAVVLVVPLLVAAQTTITADTIYDAHSFGGSPDTNFGASLNLDVYVDSGQYMRALVMMDISSLPADKVIDNATLFLYQKTHETDDDVMVHYVNDTFEESAVTYNNRPCGTGAWNGTGFDDAANCNATPEDTIFMTGSTGFKQWDVAAAIKRASAEGRTNVTLIVKSSETISQPSFLAARFRSQEDSPAGERPFINITYSDVPIATPTVTILNPENDRLYATNVLDINISHTTDASLSISNYSIYINGTLNKTVFSGDNTTIDIGDGKYTMTVDLYDNSSQMTSDTINSFKIDTINPFDDLLTQIPNGTIFYTDASIDITATNTNLYGHNVTVYDSSNAFAFSSQTVNISAPTHAISIPINVVSFGVGVFRVVSNESDDHTANEIPNYVVGHDTANKQISFDTGTAEVIIQLVDAQKQVGNAPYTPINPNVLGISHAKQLDRYSFGFDFENPAADTYYYQFKIVTSADIVYRDSAYEGHFVIGDANWLDFEPYDVTVTHDGAYYYISFETADTSIMFNSIGGTNFGSSETFFEVREPVASTIQCDFGSGVQTCAAAELDVLESVSAVCDYSLNSTVSVYNITGSAFIVQNLVGTNLTNAYTYDHTDFGLTDDELNVSVFCNSDIGIDTLSVLFTPTTAPAPTDSNEFAFMETIGGAILLTGLFILIFIFVVGSTKRGGRQ